MIITLLFAFAISVFIYLGEKKKKLPVPPQVSVIKYLQNSERWHSYGHVLLEFGLTTFIMHLFINSPIIYFGFTAPTILSIISNKWLFVIPSFVLVMFLELYVDKHYKDWYKDFDFWFDVITHLSGSTLAICAYVGL